MLFFYTDILWEYGSSAEDILKFLRIRLSRGMLENPLSFIGTARQSAWPKLMVARIIKGELQWKTLKSLESVAFIQDAFRIVKIQRHIFMRRFLHKRKAVNTHRIAVFQCMCTLYYKSTGYYCLWQLIASILYIHRVTSLISIEWIIRKWELYLSHAQNRTTPKALKTVCFHSRNESPAKS